VSGDGAVVNAVSIAEICVGDAEPETVADRVRSWRIAVIAGPRRGRGSEPELNLDGTLDAYHIG
jgi:hypothetical protein